MKTKINIKLTNQEASEILTTAIESNGIQYWACDYGKISIVRDNDGLITSAKFEADNSEQVRSFFHVTPAVIKNGVNKLMEIEISPAVRNSILENDIDVEAADCIVQAGIFGTVIYG